MKTNFISNLKQFLFLFVAVFGTLTANAQSDNTQTIGGSHVPGGKNSDGGLFDIGGKDRPSPVPLVSVLKTDCIFSSPKEIGGGGKGTGTTDTGSGQFDDDDFDPYDIGGKNSSGGLGYLQEIGGGGRGTSTTTGQADDDDIDPYDIGGKSTTGGLGNIAFTSTIGGSKTPDMGQGCDIGGRGSVGTGTGNLTYDIGGKNTSDDLGTKGFGTNLFDDSDDVGGRNTGTAMGQFAFNSMEFTPGLGCDVNTGEIGSYNRLLSLVDTGGRGSRGTSTTGDDDDSDYDDTGGRNSHGTTGESYELYSWDSQPN